MVEHLPDAEDTEVRFLSRLLRFQHAHYGLIADGNQNPSLGTLRSLRGPWFESTGVHNGVIVQRQDAAFASQKWGFKSP